MSEPKSKGEPKWGAERVVERADPSRIVVGVDGSEPSLAALEFAAEEATFRGAGLRVVSVWSLDNDCLENGLVPLDDQVKAARREADDAIAHAREQLDRGWPGLDREMEAIEGGLPAELLLDEAEGAVLLVVGNRGRGSLRSLVLGSVSGHVVRSARCPVAVVPHGWRPSSTRAADG